MGRFARKFKKALGNESVDSILNAGRSIKATKEYVLRDRKVRSKQQFVNNNLDKIPLNYSKELLDIATANINNIDSNINNIDSNINDIDSNINNIDSNINDINSNINNIDLNINEEEEENNGSD